VPAVRPAEPIGADQPIPFPPRRTERPVARRELPRHVAGLVTPRESEARFTPFAVPADASPAEPPPPLEALPVGEQAAEDVVDAPLIKAVLPDENDAGDFAPPQAVAADAPEVQEELPTEETTFVESAPLAPAEPAADDGDTSATAAKVSDLEREMARLLGELATRRSS
jgi:hypothetical protein